MTRSEQAKLLGQCRREIGYTVREVVMLMEWQGRKVSPGHLSRCERELEAPSDELLDSWSIAIGGLIAMREGEVYSTAGWFSTEFDQKLIEHPNFDFELRSRSERSD